MILRTWYCVISISIRQFKKQQFWCQIWNGETHKSNGCFVSCSRLLFGDNRIRSKACFWKSQKSHRHKRRHCSQSSKAVSGCQQLGNLDSEQTQDQPFIYFYTFILKIKVFFFSSNLIQGVNALIFFEVTFPPERSPRKHKKYPLFWALPKLLSPLPTLHAILATFPLFFPRQILPFRILVVGKLKLAPKINIQV